MISHLREIFWSLSVLWDLKGVVWPPDRLRLWRKTIHLYFSFLAFTDHWRPADQLRRAMVCALLTAVYDYDSDWEQGRRDGLNFHTLLERYVRSGEAYSLASGLFAGDVSQGLSGDGLERGSAALRFYWLVMDSEWMRGYTREEINSFGRKLQIVDDLLDLETDYLTYDTNCLLLEDQAQGFANEAREFLNGRFFTQLKTNSRVYRVIGTTASKVLNRFGSSQVSCGQLFQTGRPATAGLFGLVLPLVSFSFYGGVPWSLGVTCALSFMGLTMSIMVFNDWKDRTHDRKKGKLFASEHTAELWAYWVKLNVVTGGFLLLVVWYDVWLAAFCTVVWVVGILYSFIPHWYIIQNLTVALCAGSPALCGAVYNGKLNADSVLTFLLFATLLFLGEVYKDIEDARIDRGYKATLPVRVGHVQTVVNLIGLVFVPTTIALLHPNPWMFRIMSVGAPLLLFSQASMLLRPERVAHTRWVMNRVVTGLLLVLLMTSSS